MTKKPVRKMTTREKQHAAALAAMPEVKALVAKHGRAAITNCLNKIRLRDKELNKLADLKRELAEREKALR